MYRSKFGSPTSHVGQKVTFGRVQAMSGYREEQTSAERVGMSALCQKQTLLRRGGLSQGPVELVECPIYFVAGDHQWRTDTDSVVVSVLT